MNQVITFLGYTMLLIIGLFISLLLWIYLIDPILKTISLALLIIVSLLRAGKMYELQWLKFPSWLWFHYKHFIGRSDWSIKYGIKGTDHVSEWTGIFGWKFKRQIKNDSV